MSDNRPNRGRPGRKPRPQGNNRPQGSRRPQQGGRPQGPQRRRVSEDEKKFLAGTAVNPYPRIVLEKGSIGISPRAFDLITPIGMGQRALIVSPPGAGKTTFLKNICNAVTAGHPDMKVHVMLVDERPEEITDFKRSVEAEVHASSMDQSHENHLKIVDEVMEQAFKDAAAGKDVMLLIDSLTRLARVHSSQHQGSGGRTMSGGVPAGALDLPRRVFGAARNVEECGSITIIATILINTNSRMDDVIFQEFKGTGNMELVLTKKLAERRIFPAIDARQSGTRRVELLFEPEEYRCLELLYRGMAMAGNEQGMEKLVMMLRKYPTNKELLESLGRMASR